MEEISEANGWNDTLAHTFQYFTASEVEVMEKHLSIPRCNASEYNAKRNNFRQ